ncbi:uncharacterized protein LOC110880559 [Helianthus annuus]|uniref:uncharacterized protein LOC110880559 n=1 Tax=Helianthus annuus TaxID=4232 RepID=UPI000B9000B2|nr:uncharacterized protein LOC110880559 [Helianthus annuus]
MGPIWEWDWKRSPNSDEEWEQFNSLGKKLSLIQIRHTEDKWYWGEQPAGGFFTPEVRAKIIGGESIEVNISNTFWNNFKINSFVWRAIQNRIASKHELAKRGVILENQNCRRCGGEESSADHILVECPASRTVWWLVLLWIKFPMHKDEWKILDVLKTVEEMNGPKGWKKIVGVIIRTTLWFIWKSRNDVEFNNISLASERTADLIKEMTYIWITNRSRYKKGSIGRGGKSLTFVM